VGAMNATHCLSAWQARITCLIQIRILSLEIRDVHDGEVSVVSGETEIAAVIIIAWSVPEMISLFPTMFAKCILSDLSPIACCPEFDGYRERETSIMQSVWRSRGGNRRQTRVELWGNTESRFPSLFSQMSFIATCGKGLGWCLNRRISWALAWNADPLRWRAQ
jgi:hypothetical protein